MWLPKRGSRMRSFDLLEPFDQPSPTSERGFLPQAKQVPLLAHSMGACTQHRTTTEVRTGCKRGTAAFASSLPGWRGNLSIQPTHAAAPKAGGIEGIGGAGQRGAPKLEGRRACTSIMAKGSATHEGECDWKQERHTCTQAPLARQQMDRWEGHNVKQAYHAEGAHGTRACTHMRTWAWDCMTAVWPPSRNHEGVRTCVGGCLHQGAPGAAKQAFGTSPSHTVCASGSVKAEADRGRTGAAHGRRQARHSASHTPRCGPTPTHLLPLQGRQTG